VADNLWITRLDRGLLFVDNESVPSSVRDSTNYGTLSMEASTQGAIFWGILYGILILVGYLIMTSKSD
jgi:hypothetical protein